MQTSNYLPYSVTYDFKKAQRRRGYSKWANFLQKYAHRRARQAIRQFLHSPRHREPSQYKWWVSGWDID